MYSANNERKKMRFLKNESYNNRLHSNLDVFYLWQMSLRPLNKHNITNTCKN